MIGFLIGFGIAMFILNRFLDKKISKKVAFCKNGHIWKAHKQPDMDAHYLKCEKCGWVFGTPSED